MKVEGECKDQTQREGEERDIESAHARWWCVCVRMSDGAGEEDHSDTDREQEEGRKEIREPAERARVGAGREGARGGQSERWRAAQGQGVGLGGLHTHIHGHAQS